MTCIEKFIVSCKQQQQEEEEVWSYKEIYLFHLVKWKVYLCHLALQGRTNAQRKTLSFSLSLSLSFGLLLGSLERQESVEQLLVATFLLHQTLSWTVLEWKTNSKRERESCKSVHIYSDVVVIIWRRSPVRKEMAWWIKLIYLGPFNQGRDGCQLDLWMHPVRMRRISFIPVVEVKITTQNKNYVCEREYSCLSPTGTSQSTALAFATEDLIKGSADQQSIQRKG